jgi:chaperonin GroEL (HSP60 family)
VAPFKVAAVKAPGFGDRRKEMLEDIAKFDWRYRDQRRARITNWKMLT